MKAIWRRIQAINDTRIQYILVGTKSYRVTNIDLCNMIIEATETDLSIDDVNESEVFPVKELLDEYVIGLVNRKNEIDVIDMGKWIGEHGLSDWISYGRLVKSVKRITRMFIISVDFVD